MIKVFIEHELLQEIESYDGFAFAGINALPNTLKFCENSEEIEDYCRSNGYDFVYEAEDELLITAPQFREAYDPIYLFEVKETEDGD